MLLCQKVVPAWIMPLNKVFDTLNPVENKFDIVIVDEASQSDISSLILLYMAKKIIIVGDDKQVSPSDVGINIDKINMFRRKYIKGKIANDDLYAYVAYNKIVKLDLQTGKELETIAEIGKNYLSRIQFSKSTNEIIGLQSGNENEETYFKLNLKTKQFSRTPLKRYESFIIANY